MAISQLPILLIGALSGFFGSLIDSFLGGTLQYSGTGLNLGLDTIKGLKRTKTAIQNEKVSIQEPKE